MQAKGLVKFFGIALVLVCLYQLSFTFFANRVEGQAQSYAEDKVAAVSDPVEQAKQLSEQKRRYLDSVSTEQVVNLGVTSFTYKELKERQLNLGLDLQGGMSVVLQVSLQELIQSMSNESQDPTFLAALKRANELQRNSQEDYVTLFGQAFEAEQADGRLAAIFATPEYGDRINFQSSNEDVLKVIKEEADGAVSRTFEILRARIDKFGVAQPNINLQPSTGRIVVELPGVDDPERVRKLLQATAKLEFWEMYENSNEFSRMLTDADKAVKESLDIESGTTDTAPTPDEADVAEVDSTATDAADSENDEVNLLGDGGEEGDTTQTDLAKSNPLFSVLQPSPNAGPVVGYVNGADTATLNKYLKIPDVKTAFPPNLKLLLDAKAIADEENPNVFPVYAIKSRFNDFKAPMEGDVITDARQDIDYNQQVVVSMTMNSEGASMWKKLTRENIQKPVAIVLDDKVYSAPIVQAEIGGGQSQITGQFDVTEAQDLANILKAGKLPAPARIVEEAVVGPTLGKKSVSAGLWSLIAGVILVLLFMVFYYNTGGVVANIALLLNLFLVVGVLAAFGAALTLPGMAGIVLTIGMAVDANVIIFERIREELAKGSGFKKAIADGYSKSYSAIIDANVTTLITAVILFYFGLGPVLGFATVLIIGIFSSLFTAVLITRLLIDWWLGKGKSLSYATGLTKNAFKNLNIDFVNRRKVFYMISGAILLVGLLSIFTRGWQQGVDFKGGYNYVIQFPQNVSTSEIRNATKGEAILGAEPMVRTYGSGDQVKLTTSYLIDSTDPKAGDMVTGKLYEGLKEIAGNPSYEDFIAKNILSSQKVGPTIADDIKRGAFWATIFALLGIFLYILARFRRWQFGLAAVLTIAHDTLFLLSIFSLFEGILPFSLEIDQNFIAALLTVIGYSINDTVVVFDRIREYLNLYPKKDEKLVINEAINSTLSRTIITSLTTLLVVFILFIFGGEVIRGFAFALLIGIIVGTYSSICVATPLVVDLSEQAAKRQKAKTPPSKGGKKGKRQKQKV